MQTKFLKSIVESLVNKQASPIIDLLMDKKNVNEFLIAKKLKLTINQTRNILYKLSDYGLVSFIRKKDKRKGWYIYFWTLSINQSLVLLEENLKKELENLEAQVKSRKEKRYYVCNTCSIEINEETALLNDFVCPECEEVYELVDNREKISHLEKNIEKLTKDLEMVASERKIEKEKLEKKKAGKIKRAEKKSEAEKKQKRDQNKKKRKREIVKEKRKVNKKKNKKKKKKKNKRKNKRKKTKKR